ncbi:Neutral endopeptidase [Mycoplasmopsis maculosa]|uniref:Neutral endopeptidase n=1 Tax=Mycoplasmopsis maculosa TaxID=114885 RepID=A0A449B3X7_9BACT|nr:M13 family metallopeptidase [Mycoplasmopsis maculosa]VEU75286.1 Neutral endopeptidase [Mycoplasmopsis maculosa]
MSDKISIKDDFYRYTNDQWFKENKIPSDKASYGAFTEIADKNEKKLIKETKNLIEEISKKRKNEDDIITNYAKFADMVYNFDERNKLGVEPIVPFLKRILEIKNTKQFEEKYAYFSLRGYPLPFDFSVMSDFKNTDDQILYLSPTDLILPDKSYYEENHPKKEILLNAFKNMSRKLLKFYYDDENKNEEIINKALAFDSLLVEFVPSSVENADYVKMYNIFKIDELEKQSNNFNFKQAIESLIKEPVDKINITYPRYFKNIDKIFNEENLENIKAWMLLLSIIRYSKYLDENSRLISTEFQRAISGQDKPTKKEKAAFYLAFNQFGIPFGTYFAKKYFGDKAKKDVEDMIKNMISVYKENILNNDWLSKKTKEKAIIKLEALGVFVAYPEIMQPYFENFKIKTYKEDENVFSNLINMNIIRAKYELGKFGKIINRDYWSMSPMEVNAYFNPFMNHIVFPAAILDKPYYSIKQTKAENYGAIGAVIAHEISHAFDNNGANFDEKGNLNSWWTKDDFKTFNKKSEEMIKLFDGVQSHYGKCNGKLTVSENIADSGGLKCALDAFLKTGETNVEDFFSSWARGWRKLSKPEYAQMLLAVDVHAPADLRANLQLANLDLFQETYDLKKGDGMFLHKNKRVKIW